MRGGIENMGFLRKVSRNTVKDYEDDVKRQIGPLDQFLRGGFLGTLLVLFELMYRLHELPGSSPVETWVEDIAYARPVGGFADSREGSTPGIPVAKRATSDAGVDTGGGNGAEAGPCVDGGAARNVTAGPPNSTKRANEVWLKGLGLI